MAVRDATPENLQDLLGISAGDARKLVEDLTRAAGHQDWADDVLQEVNRMVGGDGLGAMQAADFNAEVDPHYVMAYVETGDMYRDTLIYEVDTEKFVIDSWGHWLETHWDEVLDPFPSESVKDWSPYD